MNEQLCSYGRHLAQKGYSPLTARDYALKARQFETWRGERPLCEETLRAYRAHLRQHAARSTVRGRLAALSLWLMFLHQAGLVEELPAVPSPLDAHESRQGRRPA